MTKVPSGLQSRRCIKANQKRRPTQPDSWISKAGPSRRGCSQSRPQRHLPPFHFEHLCCRQPFFLSCCVGLRRRDCSSGEPMVGAMGSQTMLSAIANHSQLIGLLRLQRAKTRPGTTRCDGCYSRRQSAIAGGADAQPQCCLSRDGLLVRGSLPRTVAAEVLDPPIQHLHASVHQAPPPLSRQGRSMPVRSSPLPTTANKKATLSGGFSIHNRIDCD